MRLEAVSTSFFENNMGIYKQEQKFETDSKQTENQILNLYPEITYDEFDGFGGAVTDSAAYIYSLMNKEQKEEILRTYFTKEELNYRFLRVPIDSCDFSLEPYAALEEKEGQERISFERMERYILPMLKDIYAMTENPLELMLSPWSPPAHMKTNNSRQKGGHLKKEYYKAWAEYLCKYICRFRENGFSVNRISIQNEANAVQRWDSCLYTGEEEKTFLTSALYPALKKHELEHIEIYLWDHNKERLFERALESIDEHTDSMISGLAFHWYSGDHFETMDLVKQRFPSKKLILSESCLEYSKFQKENLNEGIFALVHEIIGDLNHGMALFHDWNLCLDENGGPNYVGNYCHAPFLFHTGKKRLLPQKTLRCFYHFSHYLTKGSRRMAHSCYTKKIELTSFMKEDSTQVVILANSEKEQLPVIFRENGEIAEIMLPPESITTCEIY